MGNYREIHRRSMEDPEGFWAEAAKDIDWIKPPEKILDRSDVRFPRWFSGGVLNTCYNAIDRHVERGRADQAAIIYDSPVTGKTRTISYAELLDQVSRFAGVLSHLGVEKGDRVVVYMPMIPEALVAMLSCARIGAIHSVVFGGFAARELAIRIDDAKPKVIVSASCGIETKKVIAYKPLLDEAIEHAVHKPEHCVIYQREQARAEPIPGRDLDWEKEMASATPAACVPVAATDPLYILYTSGTTAIPKGVVRDNGGHAVAMRWSLPNIYDTYPGETYWAASDVGWVVGHSYIVYAPLLTGATTIVYEGKPVGTPDPGAFWRVISEHKVKTLFTAPTAFRAIKKEDHNGEFFRKYDLPDFRYLFLAGERLDPDTYHWASKLLGVPVVDHWWQTETGWAIAANCMGIEKLPIKPGSPSVPCPGYDIQVLDSNGVPAGPRTEGLIAVKLPLPPGNLPTLWQDDARFVSSYMSDFPGWYITGDGGYIDEDGYVYVMGRVDDVINVAGHRLSTGSMEEIVANHADVAECAVIGVDDQLKGQVPVGFVVLKAGVARSREEIEPELVAMVRKEIGAVACFKEALVVPRLPKTRSGKVLRGTMRKIADGKQYVAPSTIDDPTALTEIAEALASR
ncbi:MAG: propionyl-CoA synthetase [Actinomycetota bacterium]